MTTQDKPVITGLAPDQSPSTEAPEPTVTAVGGAEVKMVEIPREIYENAVEDNRQRNFVHAILDARTPHQRPEYVTPPVPAGVAEQTRLEMEAGRKKVLEAEGNEAERKRVTEAHKNDKWQTQGKTEAVFRPGDFVPDPRKGQGANNGARAVAVA